MPADANDDNMYELMITAQAGGETSTPRSITVSVENVDEMGRVTFWRDGADATDAAIMVGDELGGAVDDHDGNPGDSFPIAMVHEDRGHQRHCLAVGQEHDAGHDG